jgi:hypothetical protein
METNIAQIGRIPNHFFHIVFDIVLSNATIDSLASSNLYEDSLDVEFRKNFGIYYTDEENILKLIKPLFLSKIEKEYEGFQHDSGKLKALLNRVSKIKLFDPACGSGNFLIIAYKELRRLEMRILKSLQLLGAVSENELKSCIKLEQFYGIEIDDFAHQVATLSLWLAQHQMNKEFEKHFKVCEPFLPLKQSGKIICANALRIDWQEICPKTPEEEVYLLGNPPYVGSKYQIKQQKEDMAYIFKNSKSYKKLDYVACWFVKAAEYSKDSEAEFAFFATKSICQGEQVAILWPNILEKNLEISFAYKPFNWSNNARNNAGMPVIIIGMRAPKKENKYLYEGKNKKIVRNINPYLAEGEDLTICPRTNPISNLPKMMKGNMPNDGGHLLLNEKEKDEMLKIHPGAEKFIKRFMGSNELINGIKRYCVWIEDKEVEEALNFSLIAKRVESVKETRLKSKDQGAQKLANYPYKFREQHMAKNNSLIIPVVSSERREFLPIAFLDKNIIVSGVTQAIYDPEYYIFGVIASKMHMAWVQVTSGKLNTQLMYSSTLCYNNFPFPEITERQKKSIAECVLDVLNERQKHPGKTIAELYDPDKMPEGLRRAHKDMDMAIENCYRPGQPFENDEERLAYLFELYKEMIQR